MTMTATKTSWTDRDNAKAICLYPVLAAIDLTQVPVMSNNRHIGRKQQAALARDLFKALGLVGISVTTPNYSMAQSVEVRLPKLSKHDEQAWPHHHDATCCGSAEGHTEETRCRTCRVQQNGRDCVGLILAAAFPNHDDRSDSQTDYFDYCWSID